MDASDNGTSVEDNQQTTSNSPGQIEIQDDNGKDTDSRGCVDVDGMEESAEVLMTDMTLDDDIEKLRQPEPEPHWVYHIEAYPWHADDVNEHFIRLSKLATFTQLFMRKKPISHESDNPERIDDRVMERQRRGSLHLYAESRMTAKAIMRHSTWKKMNSRELTFEITKHCRTTGNITTARIDVDTLSMCRVKFREKTKGSFESRSAKISNIPKTVPRDVLDIMFSRSNVVFEEQNNDNDAEGKEESQPHQTMETIPNFSGSIDIDCLNRGSCRALVNSIKYASILGHDLTIKANDTQTMVIPPGPQKGVSFKTSTVDETSSTQTQEQTITSRSSSRGRGSMDNSFAVGRTGSLTRINSPIMGHPVQSARIHPMSTPTRARGNGGNRNIVVSQQPPSASFTRVAQGFPVPMTGRQKMNEKIRRNHPIATGHPNVNIHPSMNSSAAYRAASIKSIGDSFKQEIASLQSEFQRNTQALEEKIERLREESSYYEYNEMYGESGWDGEDVYEYDDTQDAYFDDGVGDYYTSNYDVQSLDSMGYDVMYEPEAEPVMPVGRGVVRRRVGRATATASHSGVRVTNMVTRPVVQRMSNVPMHASVQRYVNNAGNTVTIGRGSAPTRITRGRGAGSAFQRSAYY